MACFLVSAAEAAVIGAVKTAEKKREEKVIESGDADAIAKLETKIPFSRKLTWLIYMLLGGSVLLMFEHVWHGEIVAWFPFLTAVSDGSVADMLYEMATVGVCMAALITLTWFVMCKVADHLVKRSGETEEV